MARRTKEEAQETRHQILDAAEQLFEQQGVSRTSLQAIATQAGITRGAIYWHFKDKADVFTAMMERVAWPIDQEALRRQDPGSETNRMHPLASLHAVLMDSMRVITNDEQVRRLLGICHFQIEYTEDMAVVRERMMEGHDAFYQRTLEAFSDPQVAPLLPHALPPETLARTLQSSLVGLIHAWLLTPQAFDLPAAAHDAIALLLKGAGLQDTIPALSR